MGELRIVFLDIIHFIEHMNPGMGDLSSLWWKWEIVNQALTCPLTKATVVQNMAKSMHYSTLQGLKPARVLYS